MSEPIDPTAAGPRSEAPDALLRRAIDGGRVHSAYLIAGPSGDARRLALDFVRALVCVGAGVRPCGECASCRRSDAAAPGHEAIALDGSGKKGPLYRYVGDHPDLLWIERGADDTRVRIGQVRALQSALRLPPNEGGWRAAVVADAEWLNAEAQNALLRTLEEPPRRTALVLVASSAASLLATVRSRCQRVVLRPPAGEPLLGDDVVDEVRVLRERIAETPRLSLPKLLDLAEEFRGARADMADAVTTLLDVGAALLRGRVRDEVRRGRKAPVTVLDAESLLRAARRSLLRWNANPQMIAERALFALRGGLA